MPREIMYTMIRSVNKQFNNWATKIPGENAHFKTRTNQIHGYPTSMTVYGNFFAGDVRVILLGFV